jgi:excisionase family DNA binding protein
MTTNGKDSRMMTIREVAEYLNVHINTVRRWSDAGLLITYRIGVRGDRRFKPSDVSRFYTKRSQRVA